MWLIWTSFAVTVGLICLCFHYAKDNGKKETFVLDVDKINELAKLNYWLEIEQIGYEIILRTKK